jgi:putative phosphoribosyl transferase
MRSSKLSRRWSLPRGGVPVGYEVARFLDEVVCEYTPEPFRAVGLWYEDFAPTTDDEVIDLLTRATERTARTAANP